MTYCYDCDYNSEDLEQVTEDLLDSIAKIPEEFHHCVHGLYQWAHKDRIEQEAQREQEAQERKRKAEEEKLRKQEEALTLSKSLYEEAKVYSGAIGKCFVGKVDLKILSVVDITPTDSTGSTHVTYKSATFRYLIRDLDTGSVVTIHRFSDFFKFANITDAKKFIAMYKEAI